MLRNAYATAFLFSLMTAMSLHSISSTSRTFAAGYDRPVGDPHQSRSVTVAKHGIVATSQPLASQAGLDVLKSGGNAIDAAIAANAMLGLVEPASCGIGGDLFVIYWDSKTGKLYGLNASGRSPYKLTLAELRKREFSQMPTYGPLSWSVPGCVSGWEMLSKRFGTKPLREVLAPAIKVAEEGFGVTEVIAGEWRSAAERLRESPDAAQTYLVDGDRAPRFGELFRNPRLAAAYRMIGEQGADAFYRGPIAEKIVAFSNAIGGFFSLEDFHDHTSEWIDPVSTTYRGYEVWELPPNGQGIAVLQMLNVMEHTNVKNLGFGNPDYLHLFIEAKRLAYADRAKYYADMAMADVPVQGLVSKEYGRRQSARINPRQALLEIPPGDPRLQQGDTIYLSVVDKDRNCCSFIQSNFHGFGSHLVPGDLGFALQNRGALFALDEKHANCYAPHKRPFHTIIPAMVTRDGKPWFCFGVMGGDMQPQGHVQVLVNMIDFGMNVQAAGDAARIQHVGSATPTGLAAQGVGTVMVESGISNEAIAALRAKGHNVVRAKGGYGGYQGIMIDWKAGLLHGATEVRKDGAAVGY